MVLGVSFNPLIEVFERFHLPRVAVVLLVYGCVALLFAVFAYYAASEIGDEALNVQLDELRRTYEEIQEGTVLPPVAEVEQGLREAAPTVAGGVISGAASLVTGFVYFLTVLFSALLFTVTQDRMRGVFLAFVPPANREDTESLLYKLARRLRRFLVGELVAMLVIGAVTYAGLLILGIKLPLILAFLAFLFEILPVVGPWLAFLPALAVATTDGLLPAIQVTILYLFIQGLENYIVTPLVHGHESQMPALLILAALLIGGTLMGVLGALVALPLTVVLHTVFFEVVMPWNKRRLARTELEAVSR
jgi:predicted PurR-regulated permease PerM